MVTRRAKLGLLLVIAVALVTIYCGPSVIETPDPDGDADSDTDVDSDSDTDVDSDADVTCPGGCDDSVACTVDECIDGRCSSAADHALCPGGRCDPTRGCVECLGPEDCDDGVPCTSDRCDGSSCVTTPDDAQCPGDLTCDPVRGCVGCTEAGDCDDDNECTRDDCSDGACENDPDDGLCTGAAQRCSATEGCVECLIEGHCDDGLACNGEEECTSDGRCDSGPPIDCNDGVSCTVDTCSEAGGGRCINTPDDVLCTSGQYCDAVSGCSTDQTFYAHTSTSLYLIDLAPIIPTATEIGPMGTTITDIAMTSSGTLYAVSFTNFYRVNVSTGTATLIGPLGVGSVNGLTVAPDDTLYAGTTTSGHLYRIDPATGTATDVGAFGTGMTSSGDIVWGPLGAIYVPDPEGTTDRLISVNPLTGAGSPIGDTGFDDVYGLSYTGGVLLGLVGTGELIALDVSTGAGTVLYDFDLTWWGAS